MLPHGIFLATLIGIFKCIYISVKLLCGDIYWQMYKIKLDQSEFCPGEVAAGVGVIYFILISRSPNARVNAARFFSHL